MDIKEINKKTVKLSDGSITVKDADGKTAGIVRGVRRFAGVPNPRSAKNAEIVALFICRESGEAANTYAEYNALHNEFAGYSKGIAAIMRAFERIVKTDSEKAYRSNSAFERDVAEVKTMLAVPVNA